MVTSVCVTAYSIISAAFSMLYLAPTKPFVYQIHSLLEILRRVGDSAKHIQLVSLDTAQVNGEFFGIVAEDKYGRCFGYHIKYLWEHMDGACAVRLPIVPQPTTITFFPVRSMRFAA